VLLDVKLSNLGIKNYLENGCPPAHNRERQLKTHSSPNYRFRSGPAIAIRSWGRRSGVDRRIKGTDDLQVVDAVFVVVRVPMVGSVWRLSKFLTAEENGDAAEHLGDTDPQPSPESYFVDFRFRRFIEVGPGITRSRRR